MFGFFKKRQPEPDPSLNPPISHADLRQLFEYLDRPNPPACDHSHRETTEFLQSKGLPIESTLKWLRDNGGFCDCEVIFNVTDEWGDKVGWIPTDDGEE